MMLISLQINCTISWRKTLQSKEIKAVESVLKSQSPYRFEGIKKVNFVKKFELKLKNYINSKNCLALSSGTAALDVAINCLDDNHDKNEVILPAYGWISNLMVILKNNYIPIIAPVDEYLNICTKSIKKLITKKTKAVIVVHMRGCPTNINDILEITKKKNIPIIEDCSQSLGAMIGYKKVGCFGAVSTFSFQYNKLITAGEGGAICFNSKKYYQKAKFFHDVGLDRISNKQNKIQGIGLNYRMSEITGALLYEQLKKINTILRGLKVNKKKLLNYFSKFQLKERVFKNDLFPNNAFLNIIFKEKTKKKKFLNFLNINKINFSQCNELDAHNFLTWEKFLKTKKLIYSSIFIEQSKKNLDKNIFFEINSVVK